MEIADTLRQFFRFGFKSGKMKLRVVGCSHHNSPIQLRERLAFNDQQARAALADLRERFPDAEAVLLSREMAIHQQSWFRVCALFGRVRALLGAPLHILVSRTLSSRQAKRQEVNLVK